MKRAIALVPLRQLAAPAEDCCRKQRPKSLDNAIRLATDPPHVHVSAICMSPIFRNQRPVFSMFFWTGGNNAPLLQFLQQNKARELPYFSPEGKQLAHVKSFDLRPVDVGAFDIIRAALAHIVTGTPGYKCASFQNLVQMCSFRLMA